MSDNNDESKINNIHSLKFNVEHFKTLSPIMTVTKVVNGEARVILNEELNTSFQVQFHGSNVPFLKQGDQVIVTATSSGVMILDRIRVANELPYPRLTQLQDGSYEIDAKQGITIKSPKATVKVTATGEITIAGVRIDLTDIQNYNSASTTH